MITMSKLEQETDEHDIYCMKILREGRACTCGFEPNSSTTMSDPIEILKRIALAPVPQRELTLDDELAIARIHALHYLVDHRILTYKDGNNE